MSAQGQCLGWCLLLLSTLLLPPLLSPSSSSICSITIDVLFLTVVPFLLSTLVNVTLFNTWRSVPSRLPAFLVDRCSRAYASFQLCVSRTYRRPTHTFRNATFVRSLAPPTPTAQLLPPASSGTHSCNTIDKEESFAFNTTMKCDRICNFSVPVSSPKSLSHLTSSSLSSSLHDDILLVLADMHSSQDRAPVISQSIVNTSYCSGSCGSLGGCHSSKESRNIVKSQHLDHSCQQNHDETLIFTWGQALLWPYRLQIVFLNNKSYSFIHS